MHTNIKSFSLRLLGFFSAFALIAPCYAAGEGFLLGLQVGMSNTNNGREAVPSDGSGPSTVVKPDTTGIAGRVYGGYDFTYGGWEFGLARFAPADYSASTGSGTIRTSMIDLDAKGIFPFFADTGFSLYGKLGLAFLRASRTRSVTPPNESGSTTAFYPLASLGVGYSVTARSMFDLSLTKVFGRSSAFAPITFVALGFSYHFANEYCGQFIC